MASDSGGGGGGGGGGGSGSHSTWGLSGIASMKSITLWMLITAAVAAAVAVAAVIAGQRRSNIHKHSLSGSVARRMEIFGSLADNHNLCIDRPARGALN